MRCAWQLDLCARLKKRTSAKPEVEYFDDTDRANGGLLRAVKKGETRRRFVEMVREPHAVSMGCPKHSLSTVSFLEERLLFVVP